MSRASSGNPATPREIVNCPWGRASCPLKYNSSIALRMRSPISTAPDFRVSGRMTENSSPPNRLTTSMPRTLARSALPTCTSARSPAGWPLASL